MRNRAIITRDIEKTEPLGSVFSNQSSLFDVDIAFCIRIGLISLENDVFGVGTCTRLEDRILDCPGEQFGGFPAKEQGTSVIQVCDLIGDEVGLDVSGPV